MRVAEVRAGAARITALGRGPAGASRLAVLVVVAAGFLTMHGFLALSAVALCPVRTPHPMT